MDLKNILRYAGLFFYFTLTCLYSQSELSLETYYVMGKDPTPMVQMAKAILGQDRKVIYDNNQHQLLIFATPEEHKKLKATFEQVNKPSKTVRIDVGYSESQSEQSAGAGVQVRRNKIRGRLQMNSGGSSQNTHQFIVTQSGYEASIEVGSQVPYQDWFLEYGYHTQTLIQSTNYQFVGSRLIVTPLVTGDKGQILIEIVPEFSVMTGGREEKIRFTRAKTQITAFSGETISLGGFSENKDFYEKFLVGMSEGGEFRNIHITLTPEIQN